MFFLRRGAKTRKSDCFSPVSLKSDAIFVFFGEAMLSMLHQEQKTKKAEPLTKKESFRQEFAPKKRRQTKTQQNFCKSHDFCCTFVSFLQKSSAFFKSGRIKVSENAIFGNCFAKFAWFAVVFSKKRRFLLSCLLFCAVLCAFSEICAIFACFFCLFFCAFL